MGILITRLQQEKDGYFMPVVLFCGSDSELNRADTIVLCGFRFNVYIIIYAGSVFFGIPCIRRQTTDTQLWHTHFVHERQNRCARLCGAIG